MHALGQGNSWNTFNCPGTRRRWRVLADHRIEVDGVGVPMRAWPSEVNQWDTLIAMKAAKYDVPAYWVAAIMALETGGRPGLCLRKADGSCNTREGMGLMAMLLSTAKGLAGRTVTQHELLNDYDLQIDLGAKLIKRLSDQYAGDYVKVAISYNAGSVRCGNGSTFNLPKEPCPPTPWGVIMGCIRTGRTINAYCAPSTIESGKYACPVDYPQVAIGTHNSAIVEGWTPFGLGTKPPPPPNGNSNGGEPVPPWDRTPPARAGLDAAAILPLLAAGIVGFYGYQYLARRRRRR